MQSASASHITHPGLRVHATLFCVCALARLRGVISGSTCAAAPCPCTCTIALPHHSRHYCAIRRTTSLHSTRLCLILWRRKSVSAARSSFIAYQSIIVSVPCARPRLMHSQHQRWLPARLSFRQNSLRLPLLHHSMYRRYLPSHPINMCRLLPRLPCHRWNPFALTLTLSLTMTMTTMMISGLRMKTRSL